MPEAAGPAPPRSLAPYGAAAVRALLGLGFAAGLPLLLTGATLSAWLTSEGVDLAQVGLLSLVALPYSLKFLWAPAFDGADRRRAMAALLLLLGGALLLLSGADPRGGALPALALLVALLAASQDLVIDAYRADALRPQERAAGSASYVLGYRAAMVVAGTGALILSERLPFPVVYRLLAGLLLLCAPLSLLAPAPERRADEAPGPRASEPLRAALLGPLRELLRRPGAARTLALVALYKLGEAPVLALSTAFLLRLGFSRATVGTLGGGLGLGATLCGAALAGLLWPRLGERRGLLLFGALQAAANLGYAALAVTGASRPLLVGAVLLDNLCGGLGSTAFVAYLTGLCHPRHRASQYALLSSLSGVAGRLVAAGSGYLVQAVGWPRFFVLTALLALPALWLLRPGARPVAAGPQR